MYYEVLLVSYLIVAILLVGFVLIQQGKGADMGASFGAGGSNTIFGSSGSGNFMTRTTAILATLFFTISLIIGGITAGTSEAVDEFETIQPLALEEVNVPQSTGDEFPVMVEDVQVAEEEIEAATEEIEVPNPEDKP